jgi:hypothetical protein
MAPKETCLLKQPAIVFLNWYCPYLIYNALSIHLCTTIYEVLLEVIDLESKKFLLSLSTLLLSRFQRDYKSVIELTYYNGIRMAELQRC